MFYLQSFIYVKGKGFSKVACGAASVCVYHHCVDGQGVSYNIIRRVFQCFHICLVCIICSYLNNVSVYGFIAQLKAVFGYTSWRVESTR